eukprot:TRINITY_DN10724_c0_g1_i2.p1 TRINITY_DN10724_c0_g1~~TRINITY_DN10724_c0_g1_i2.p1  ORF type:complete len:462 (-),score=122.67 TRINITY_DN10724_c0_g1_i2:86-1471(-)
MEADKDNKGATMCTRDLATIPIADLIRHVDTYNREIAALESEKRNYYTGQTKTVDFELISNRLKAAQTEKEKAEKILEGRLKSEEAPTLQKGLLYEHATVNKGSFRYYEEAASEELLPHTSKVTYWNYIQPSELAKLVVPRSTHHEEHLFIVVHQVFELWFKQILHDLTEIQSLLVGPKSKGVVSESSQDHEHLITANSYLHRCDKILRASVVGFEILETMDPGDFLDYREYLGDGSGFQSTQFRELEIIIGVEKRPNIGGGTWEDKFKSDGCPFGQIQQIAQRKETGSLKSALYTYLRNLNIPNLDEFVEAVLSYKSKMNEEAKVTYDSDGAKNFFFGDTPADKQTDQEKEILIARRATLFLFTWRDHPRWHLYAKFVTGLVNFEQAFVIWRQRHPRMVEIMIGRRLGTGGSSGVAYLDSTTNPIYRVFSDMIRVRGEAMARHHFPEGKKTLPDTGIWVP